MKTNYRHHISFYITLFFTVVLTACGGGGGSGGSSSGPSINLGTPSADPMIIAPSSSATQVKFQAIVTGDATPPTVLSLDEVDRNGNIISSTVAQLADDGEAADAQLGDRIYTGMVSIATPQNSSAVPQSAEKNYRVSASVNGGTLTSPQMNFWISDCPATSRPSDPSKVELDLLYNAYIFYNEVLMTVKPGVAPDLTAMNTFAANINGHVVGCIPASRQYLIEFNNTNADHVLGVHTAITELKKNSAVQDAYVNMQSLVQPNAPANVSLLCNGQNSLNCQWYLDRIRAPKAWQLTGGGDPQLGVAVIDFGVDCDQATLKQNPSLCVPQGISTSDPLDHGTGVAGIIAAPKIPNGTGMVGVAYNTSLYPHSFINGSGSQYKMKELINAAMSQTGVRVINISAATGFDPDSQIHDALCNAIASGRLVVAAAGNSVTNAGTANSCAVTNMYPAAYHDGSSACANGADLQKGLLVVGATDINNQLAKWQSGTQTVCSNLKYAEIYAPGQDILTLSTQFGYTTKSGTSFATPMVSATAALTWSANPGMTPVQIHDQLMSSASVLNGNGSAQTTTDTQLAGKPLLDVYRAVGGSDAISNPVTTPNAFPIPATNDVPLQTIQISPEVTISGPDSPAPIQISPGNHYSINGSPFRSMSGRIRSGDRVRVRLRSADTESTPTTATLTIGGIAQTYQVTTRGIRTLPSTDDLPAQRDVTPNSDVISNAHIYSGLTTAQPIRISGGDYSLDGGATYTTNDGMLDSTQSIRVRVHSSSEFATTTRATLNIGSTVMPFAVTTPKADITPDAFDITLPQGVTGLTPNTQYITNAFTVSGINAPAPIRISGGEYSKGGEVYTDKADVVNNGDIIYVRITTAANTGDNVSATLSIGDVSRTLTLITNEYDVSGQVSGVTGLDAAGLQLQNTDANNHVTDITLIPTTTNGVTTYSFNVSSYTANTYNITVLNSPPNQLCLVINGSGTIASSNVSNVNVTCTSAMAMWTWMGGSSNLNQASIYGTKGVSGTGAPGARSRAISWSDKQGNFWLFGGEIGADNLRDLWKYDGTNWTWVSGDGNLDRGGNYNLMGVPSPSSMPGARDGGVGWSDSNGNIWIFGGYGYDVNGAIGYLNDLWKFDGSNWTWISGSQIASKSGNYGIQGIAASTNVPGGRSGSISWLDTQGNLWMFGGYGADNASSFGFLGDLWKFDGLNWIWVSGSNLINAIGNYGIKNTVDPTNIPGARFGSKVWSDSKGNVWLFGGYGQDSTTSTAFELNDLWKFDVTNLTWIWISGSELSGQASTYGKLGIADPNNMPGAREGAAGWMDAQGNLWLFGGGFDNDGQISRWNDLWKFDGINWTWVGGSSISDAIPSYGTLGVSDSTNAPGARWYDAGWIDSKNNFWLFGGEVIGISGGNAIHNYSNDLWRFQP